MEHNWYRVEVAMHDAVCRSDRALSLLGTTESLFSRTIRATRGSADLPLEDFLYFLVRDYDGA